MTRRGIWHFCGFSRTTVAQEVSLGRLWCNFGGFHVVATIGTRKKKSNMIAKCSGVMKYLILQGRKYLFCVRDTGFMSCSCLTFWWETWLSPPLTQKKVLLHNSHANFYGLFGRMQSRLVIKLSACLPPLLHFLNVAIKKKIATETARLYLALSWGSCLSVLSTWRLCLR